MTTLRSTHTYIAKKRERERDRDRQVQDTKTSKLVHFDREIHANTTFRNILLLCIFMSARMYTQRALEPVPAGSSGDPELLHEI